MYNTLQKNLLKKYFKNLPDKCLYACSCNKSVSLLAKNNFTNIIHIPLFLSWQNIQSKTGIGNFCLFHANLSDPENEKTAFWLLSHIFNKVRVPFIIAGKDPSARLQNAASLCCHTCIVSNPTEAELEELIRKAQVNILPCLHHDNKGVHIKLLHALYSGRHCVVNDEMIKDTGLEDACYCGSDSNALVNIISQLYYKPFDEEEIRLRKALLCPTYNNDKNITPFINYLW